MCYPIVFVLVVVVLGGFEWCILFSGIVKVSSRAKLHSNVDQIGVGWLREVLRDIKLLSDLVY